MESSVKLTSDVFSRAARKARAWTEKMVDRWFAEDESDFDEHLDRWSRIVAIIVCIAACVYILIPAVAILWGIW